MKLFTISINAITQNKQKVEENHVLEFVEILESGKKLPPIKLRKSGDAYILVDGRHRLAAHKALGLDSIDATLTL